MARNAVNIPKVISSRTRSQSVTSRMKQSIGRSTRSQNLKSAKNDEKVSETFCIHSFTFYNRPISIF